MCDRAGKNGKNVFLGKNAYQVKMVKNDPKKWFLNFLRKSCH